MRFRVIGLAGLVFFSRSLSFAAAQPVENLYQAGLDSYHQGKYDESILQLQLAWQANPDNWQALEVIAYDFYAEVNYPESLRACDLSLGLHPDNPTLRQFAAKLRQDVTDAATTSLPVLPPLPAAEAPKNSLYLDAGPASPEGSDGLASPWALGPEFGIGFGFGMSRYFSLLLDASYSNFAVSPNYNPETGNAGLAGNLHVFTVLANAKIKFLVEDNPVVPYLILGLGVAGVSQDSTTYTFTNPQETIATPSSSSTAFAFRRSLGVEVKHSPGTYLFFEVKGITTSYSASSGYSAVISSLVYDSLLAGVKLDL